MLITIRPQTLKAILTDGQELALLDAREDGEFGEGHNAVRNAEAIQHYGV